MRKILTAALCLMMALCILPAQALTLAAPFTFDLDTFQTYYAMLIQTDVAWTQQENWIVGSATDLPDVQLCMSEAGDVEYMLVQMTCPIEEADTALGEATVEEKMAGLTTYGPLANHEGCVGVQVSEDGTMNLLFMFAPDGTQFE